MVEGKSHRRLRSELWDDDFDILRSGRERADSIKGLGGGKNDPHGTGLGLIEEEGDGRGNRVPDLGYDGLGTPVKASVKPFDLKEECTPEASDLDSPISSASDWDIPEDNDDALAAATPSRRGSTCKEIAREGLGMASAPAVHRDGLFIPSDILEKQDGVAQGLHYVKQFAQAIRDLKELRSQCQMQGGGSDQTSGSTPLIGLPEASSRTPSLASTSNASYPWSMHEDGDEHASRSDEDTWQAIDILIRLGDGEDADQPAIDGPAGKPGTHALASARSPQTRSKIDEGRIVGQILGEANAISARLQEAAEAELGSEVEVEMRRGPALGSPSPAPSCTTSEEEFVVALDRLKVVGDHGSPAPVPAVTTARTPTTTSTSTPRKTVPERNVTEVGSDSKMRLDPTLLPGLAKYACQLRAKAQELVRKGQPDA